MKIINRSLVTACFIAAFFSANLAFASLGVSSSVSVPNIYPGQTDTLTITISNSSASPVSLVDLASSLPNINTAGANHIPGLKIASGVVQYNCFDPETSITSDGIGTVTANVGTRPINLSGGVIPAQFNSTAGTCTIAIPVTGFTDDGAGGSPTYVINSGDLTANGVSQNSLPAQVSINVLQILKPLVTKSFSNNTAILGGSARTLTITVSNPNSTPLQNFSVNDNLPSIIAVAATPNSSANCTGSGVAPAFTPSAGDISVSAVSGTIAGNGSCTMKVDVEATNTGGLYQTSLQTNTINGSTDFTSDIGIIPNNATAQIKAQSPFNVTTAFAHASIASGQSDSLNIIFSNTGSNPLTVTSFTDNNIDGVGNASYGIKVSGAPTVNCSGSGSAGSYDVNGTNTGITQTSDTTIAAGGTCTITIPYVGTVQTANTPISFTHNIPVGAVVTSTAGIVSQNASASVLVADNLRVTKTALPSNPTPGNPVKYTVTTENWSASAISNLEITDGFSNGQTFLTGTINGIDYTPTLSGSGCSGLSSSSNVGDGSALFTIANVPARANDFTPASCTVTFYSMTSQSAINGATVSNNIPAGAVCYNSGAICNGSASNTTSATITSKTLTATKSFSPAGPLLENVVSKMTIVLSNASAGALTSASISDNLPIASTGGQMRIATPPNAASTCSGAAITAVAGSTSITMNNATIPARSSNGTGANGSCNLQVDIVAPAGTYNNTAVTSATQTFANGNTALINPLNSNTATITFNSAIAATKSFSPSAVNSGGKSTVTIRLNNSGNVALTGIQVTDPLPSGMTLANPVNAHTTCAGSTSFTGNSGASSIVMNDANIAGNGSCDMVFDVVASGSSNWVNTIPAGNIIADGGVSNQSAVSGTLIHSSGSGITVSKAFGTPSLVFPGQTSSLTVTINNNSPSDLTNLNVTDYFTNDGNPLSAWNGVQITTNPNSSTTCTGGILNAQADGQLASISGVTLLQGHSCAFTTNVTLTQTNVSKNNFINPAYVTNAQGLTISGPVVANITTNNAIGVTKKFTPNAIKPGQRSRLRITIINPTIYPTSSAAVTDNLPSGLIVPSNPNPFTNCIGATITTPTSSQVVISGANVPAPTSSTPASCYAEIDVTAANEGNYVNTIPGHTLSADVGGKPSDNDQPATDILRVKNPVEIHIAIDGKTLDTGSLPSGFSTGIATTVAGTPKTLTIALKNPNSDDLTGATFLNNLPAGLAIAQTPNASTTCSGGFVNAVASGTSIGLTGATLANGSTCKVTVDVVSNIFGTHLDTIPVNNVTTFEGVTNEEPTNAQITISNPPAVSKQFEPSVIPTGGISKLTIFLTNDNSAATTLTSIFTDNLPTAPGNVLVAPTPNVVKTCPGSVTANAGSATVSYANGASIPAGGCSITVDVTASVIGSYTNNIPAAALTTTFGNNQQPAFANLGVSAAGFISGTIFKDNNSTPNGTFEFGIDTPIQGATVSLRHGGSCAGSLVTTDINGNALTNPTTTDISGNYLFYGSDGLAAGTYSVCQPAPQLSGTLNGVTTAGSITSNSGSTGVAGTASNPTSSTSQIAGIVLNGDGTAGAISGSSNNNFAEVISSTISGRLFLDQNNNGIQNGSDTALSGQTIELLDSADLLIRTVVTDANGDYSFAGLAPNTYSIRQPNQPANSNSGKTIAGTVGNGGTAGTGTVPNTTPSKISNIILPPNTITSGNNFAEIPNTKTISGSVFLDYDNNHVQNGNDYGLNNVILNLTGIDSNGNSVSATTTTNSSGIFEFSGLPEGTYTITQNSQPNGTTNGTTTAGDSGSGSNPTATTSQITNIVLDSATLISSGHNFAEIPNNAVDLTIQKTHSPTSFGEGSTTGVFTLAVKNIGTTPTSGLITVIDNLPAGMTIAAPAAGSGWNCSGAIGASNVTCTSSNIVAGGANANQIQLRVKVASGTAGQVLVNNARVSGGNETAGFDGNNSDSDSVGISNSVAVQGTIWRDTNHDKIKDLDEATLNGWIVNLLLNGAIVETTTTAANGTYSFNAVSPGEGYKIEFRSPITGLVFGGAVTNEHNNGNNPANADLSNKTLDNLKLYSATPIYSEQSLPVDPEGIIYDSVTRTPISGAAITISGPSGFNPTTDLVGGTNTITTGNDGAYQFLLTSTAPVGNYTLNISSYPAGYNNVPSNLIPACSNTLTVLPFPNPAAIQSNNSVPTTSTSGACPSTSAVLSANPTTTQYYFTFNFNPTSGVNQSGNIINNHIPLDPARGDAVVVTKTSPLVNVNIGQLVPYTIVARNTTAIPFNNLNIIDTVPAGFKYKSGSATVNDIYQEPILNGRQLKFSGNNLLANGTINIKMLLVVGSGVQVGKYTNNVQLFNNTLTPISNIGSATVNVAPDPLFDCSEIIGKVFDDANADGYQNENDKGMPNVRVATVDGLLVTTDSFGRFHIACAAIPDADRGSNFIMKLDERSLPAGYHVTSENPRVVRLTRGKMTKLNFGVSLYKTLQLDLKNDAFEPNSQNLKPEWNKQLQGLAEKMTDGNYKVKINYLKTVDEKLQLVKQRLKNVIKSLKTFWNQQECCKNKDLDIEDKIINQSKDQLKASSKTLSVKSN